MPREKRESAASDGRPDIKAALLVERLQDYALGKLEMTPGQIRAAEILLRKTVADLSTLPALDAGSAARAFVIIGVPEAESIEEWSASHAPGTRKKRR